ncbi:MAG: hypothetical protein CBD04_006535 [bacterium TMED144]|nr:MAG: hypothetical protein CBD04_006535 [bacterium TMED144]|tara:strand:+ start:473 stop:1816 length:1344 start_codon:yes stop_codon:yes gene_type:complete
MLKLIRYIIAITIIINSSYSATRIAYLRPGPMMKIPFSMIGTSPYLFTAGFGTEFHNLAPINTAKGFYYNMQAGGWLLGFSTGSAGDTTNIANLDVSTYRAPVEFGFHLQRQLYSKDNISFSLGLQDIVFENKTSGLNLDPNELSFFGVISSEQMIRDFKVNTFLGFGTGGFGAIDTIEVDSLKTSGTSAGVFMGLIFNTPYLDKWGGIDIVGEFDGNGINVGLRIPLTSDYRLNLGFTHIEKLPNWKDRYWEGHAAFTLGFEISAARSSGVKIPGGGPSPNLLPNDKISQSNVDTTLMIADYAVNTLRDSMGMMNNEMRNLMIRLAAMEQHSKFLEDSLKAVKLNNNVSEQKMNDAMRHLSRSLRYFYAGNYRSSLQEVESALELNPNLALAYARRGSIYYKLGDVQRATINWNLALRMDPEYDDVRNVLKALHENRLKSTTMIEE